MIGTVRQESLLKIGKLLLKSKFCLKICVQEFGICFEKRSVRDKFCAKSREWPINKRNTPIIMTVADIFKNFLHKIQ